MEKLQSSSLVYLCVAHDGSSRVSKLIPDTAYPMDLHREMAGRGLAPTLLPQPAELHPGGFRLLEMEHLGREQGWEQLSEFSGDAAGLPEACNLALQGLHSCLGGTAVHGDLRPPNIFVRYACLLFRFWRCMVLCGYDGGSQLSQRGM